MTTDADPNAPMTRVAIDIAKRSHAVLVELPDGRRRRFRMASSADDHDRLAAFLREVPGPVVVALEPTGDCHRTLAHRLLREGHQVCLVSALAGALRVLVRRDGRDPHARELLPAKVRALHPVRSWKC